jgi:hypothetical protein
MQVSLDATHRLPLSVQVLFGQQGPNELPQAAQLPAWQTVAALPPSGASHTPSGATHTPFPAETYLQHPPAAHGFGCGMPNVGQQGCPGAPQASQVLAMQIVLVAHAAPGPTHLFVERSQHAVEAQAGPEVQHGSPS